MSQEKTERHPLTHIRHQRGWSMEDLARLLSLAAKQRGMRMHPGRDRIYKWETRRATPGEDYQMLLADVLDVDQAHVLRLGWPWWLPAYDTPRPFTVHGAHAALTEVLVALDRPDRRAFLALTTGALAGLARDWATIEPERLTGALDGRRVDTALLNWLETRTGELRALTNTNAPECADLVHSLLRTTIRILRTATYSEPTGRRLLQVVASTAQCAGWLHFDQGEHGSSQRHWRAALHAAHTADDRDLGAGILSDLAYAATWLHQPATAVTLLEHARTRTHSPATRSLLDLRRSRALAFLGDRQATGRTLAQAERELDRACLATTPAWVSWMSPADLAIDAGRCWIDLGHPGRAENALAEGVALLTPDRVRTRSVALAYRAEAALARHDVPAAATHADTALETALSTGATRCIALVRNTISQLAPYRAHQRVAEP